MNANSDLTYFTTPVGRYVTGSHNVPRTKDGDGRPLLIKNGPDAGKPTQKFDIGLAIPKGRETDWKQTEWGQKFVAAAAKAWPNGQHNSPLFSWKVVDGDSQVPNTRGKKPCDNEGHRGHWVIYFSSSRAPQTVNNTGSAQVDPNSIKKGDWVQISGSIKGNGTATKPGMFINHHFLSFQWAGDPIVSGPDPSTLGFGTTPAPAGASTQPTGNFTAPAPAAPSAPVQQFAPPPAAPAAPAAPVPVVPHTAILTPPAPPAGPQMTPKANGMKYEDFIKQGWNDALLKEHGYLAA